MSSCPEEAIMVLQICIEHFRISEFLFMHFWLLESKMGWRGRVGGVVWEGRSRGKTDMFSKIRLLIHEESLNPYDSLDRDM